MPSHRLLLRAGLHPPGRAGRLHLAAARQAGARPGDRRSSARRWPRSAARRSRFPALLPREPYDVERPLDRVRRRHLHAQGPARRRLPARADARGDVRPARAGHDQLLPGLPADPVPGADQVPRRGPAAGRPAARPRVPDEGRLLVRPLRRGAGRRRTRRIARRVPADLRAARADAHDRRGDVRAPWAARRPRSSWPPPTSARTRSSAAPPATTRRTPRPWSPRARGRRDRPHAPADRARHPGHPDDRLAGRAGQRPRAGRPHRLDRRRHPEERRGHRAPPGHATTSCWSSACPATARST